MSVHRPSPLHMEYLNRVVKNGIRGLGANKTETAMIRLGKCVNTISDVMENNYYDNELIQHQAPTRVSGANAERMNVGIFTEGGR